MCSHTAFEQHDYQLNYISTVRCRCDGVTPHSFWKFFVNGKIERYKLAGFKIEYFNIRNLYPETSRAFSCVFNFHNFAFAPWFGHEKKFLLNLQTEIYKRIV